MNTRISTFLPCRQVLTLAAFMMAVPAFAQLQWSSYNNTGGLVTANIASGGDATYGGTVSFTVPASTQRIFVTKNFATINLTNASASKKVPFTMTASGGITGVSSRAFGMGLFNDPGTPANALDDKGFWTDFTTKFEMFDRLGSETNFFQFTTTQGTGSGGAATPTDGNTYQLQFQLNVNSANTGISEGTSSSSLAAAGSSLTNITGAAMFATAYINPVPFTALGVSNFNEFAFSFNNTTVNPVTVTLGGVGLVPLNPVLNSQPLAFGGSPGSTASFGLTVNTNSATPLINQWYEISGGVTNALVDEVTVNGSTISGSSTTNLTFSNAQAADSGSVFFVANNSFGSVTSSVVALVISAPFAPVINFVQPTVATVTAGNSTNIFVGAIAVPSPVYYWTNNIGDLIQAGPSPTLTLANVQLINAGTYSVTASNQVGMTSSNFTINVLVTPSISSPPTNLLLNVGDPANFSVTASGSPTPTYQWFKNAILIPGATATNFSIASVVLTNIANYTVVVSNAAGSVTSPNAKLAINSTMAGSPLLPANNSTRICVDTYFKISFNQTPGIGNVGKVRIFDASNPATPVDTIDMSLNNNLNVQPHTLFFGDSQVFNYFPVIITGTTATIYPHSGILTTGKTYYLNIDPGVIIDSSGAYFTGISDATTWQFTTKSTGPVDPANPVVAADGTADFVTVQGAVDSLTANGPVRRTINIHNGTYTEIVDVTKTNITFRGQSRTGTIVGYANNNNLTGTTHGRMAFKVNASNLAIENLTIQNTTPQGGSQAEALMIESGASHFVLNNAEVDSRQDTILANVNTSQGYFYNSLVTGNFDYIWGGGNLFFTNCEIRTITGVTTPNLVAPRTDNGVTGNWPGFSGLLVSNGFSFVRCELTRSNNDVTINNCSMSDANGSPNGLAAWINCNIDTACYTNAIASAQTSQLLWEFGCSNINNTVLLDNTHGPFIGFTQLNTGDPRLLAAQNATNWLNGWVPGLLPNILGQPAGQAVAAGQSATFSASATGIPDPTYQWLDNGVSISGAVGSSLTIASAVRTNGGSYSVVVNNGSGSVTSAVAVLTYNNTAPVAGATFSIGALVGVPVTVPIIGGKHPPTDADGDAMTITSAGGAANGTVTTDGVNVTYTATNGASDSFTYTVSDGFGGNTPGTINVTINANSQGYNELSAASQGVGTNVVTFLGIPGYNYALDMATNLVAPIDWMPQTTNPAAGNGYLIYTNVTSESPVFYRTRYVP